PWHGEGLGFKSRRVHKRAEFYGASEWRVGFEALSVAASAVSEANEQERLTPGSNPDESISERSEEMTSRAFAERTRGFEQASRSARSATVSPSSNPDESIPTTFCCRSEGVAFRHGDRLRLS